MLFNSEYFGIDTWRMATAEDMEELWAYSAAELYSSFDHIVDAPVGQQLAFGASQA
jgi:hypothetical protein